MGHPFNSSRHNSGTTCHMVDVAQNLITKARFFFLILHNLLTSETVSVKQEPFVIQIFVLKGFRQSFLS